MCVCIYLYIYTHTHTHMYTQFYHCINLQVYVCVFNKLSLVWHLVRYVPSENQTHKQCSSSQPY